MGSSVWCVRPGSSPAFFCLLPFVPIYGSDQGSWKAILVALIPRILIGVVPYFVYKGCQNLEKQTAKSFATDCWCCWRLDEYDPGNELDLLLVPARICGDCGKAGNAVYAAILGVIFAQGVPEAIVAGIATMAVGTVLCA